MKIRILCWALLGIIPVEASSQVRFVIPADSIVDYSQYDRIEVCGALWGRMKKQLSRKNDSAYYQNSLFVKLAPDTTHPRIRWSVHECMKKFDIASIAAHDSVLRGHSIRNSAMVLYYVGKHQDRFSTLVATSMQAISPTDTGFRAVINRFQPTLYAIRSVTPVDWALADSLQDIYVVPTLTRNPKDIPPLAAYYQILSSRIDRIYDESPEASLQEYQKLVTKYQNEVVPVIRNDSSYAASEIRHVIRRAYDKINFSFTLDSLRSRGPDGYFSSLQLNHQLAGFSGNRVFAEAVGKEMITPQAFVVYRPGTTPWKSPMVDGRITNKPYPLSQDGKPYIFIWMDALCRKEHRNLRDRSLRNTTGETSCWGKYNFIKWLNREYPDLPVTVLTTTIGHYSELAATDPVQESEFIRDAWWNYHKLKANILVYYVDNFNLQGFDKRREDIHEGNKDDFLKLVDTKNRYGQLISQFVTSLVAPDGRILTTVEFSTKRGKELLDAFQAWYTTSQRRTASQQ